MKEIEILHNNSLIPEKEIKQLEQQLKKEIKRMHIALEQGYSNDRCSINLVDDKQLMDNINQLVKQKSQLKPEYFILIGIGGSHLGGLAVKEALQGKLKTQSDDQMKILFVDTVDSDLVYDTISTVEPVLSKGGNILINVVSKSGTTTETITNFQAFIDLIKKYKEDYHKYIVATTDKNSKLWNITHDQGFDFLEIPYKVGGRFSVFSPVGLFPLAMIGVDIYKLCKAAEAMRRRCLSYEILDNPAALSASLIYKHWKKGENIHVLFLFNTYLESLGKWYRQLMAESLGKEYNLEGKQVFDGITPIISIGSTDLHSMAQLYLGGPYDKFTTFVKVIQNHNEIIIPNNPIYSDLVKGIQNRKMSDIMNAIYNGTRTAYQKGRRPFIEIVLPDKSEYSMGQFLQYKMMEIMYLGFLMNINPFDQPNVESYKTETRKILKK